MSQKILTRRNSLCLTMLITLLLGGTGAHLFIGAHANEADPPRRATEIKAIAWSPNGKEFIFATNRTYEASEGGFYLWRVGVDGKGIKQLTFPGKDGKGKFVPYEDNNPQWSPDGKLIAFDSNRGERRTDDKSELTQVFVCDADGQNTRQLSSGQGWCDNEQPAWSPDGKQLAWVTDRNGGTDIMLADANGRELRYLAVTHNLAETYPCWTSDGAYIVFTAKREGIRDYAKEGAASLYRRETAATKLPQITKPKILTTIPGDSEVTGTCSPVGNRIVFINQSAQQKYWVMDIDGKGLRGITNGGDILVSANVFIRPIWGPHADRVAFVDASERALPADVYEDGIWMCGVPDGPLTEVPLPPVPEPKIELRGKSK